MLLMKGTHHDFALRMGLDPDWHKDPANFQYLAMCSAASGPSPAAKNPGTLSNVEPCLSNQEAVEMLVAGGDQVDRGLPGNRHSRCPADDILNKLVRVRGVQQAATDNYVSASINSRQRVHQRWPEKKVSLIAYFDTVFPHRGDPAGLHGQPGRYGSLPHPPLPPAIRSVSGERSWSSLATKASLARYGQRLGADPLGLAQAVFRTDPDPRLLPLVGQCRRRPRHYHGTPR